MTRLSGMGDEGCPKSGRITDLGQFGAGRAGFCMRLSNSGTRPVDVDLPEGLMILAQGDEFQNGMLVGIVPITITTEPGGVGGLTVCPHEEVLVALATYCLNHSRSFPEPSGDFKLGPVTNIPELATIARAVVGKDVSALSDSIQQYLDDFSEGDTDRSDLDTLLAEIAEQPDLPNNIKKRRCPPPPSS